MGFFRFRRSIKIAPGIRWNIGKKSTSVSLGGHGLTYTVGTKGSRTTIGLPGTGVSYTQIHASSKASPPSPPPLAAGGNTVSGVTAPTSVKLHLTAPLTGSTLPVLSRLSAHPPSIPAGRPGTPTAPKPASAKFFYGVGTMLLVIWILSKTNERHTPATIANSSSIPLPSPTVQIPALIAASNDSAADVTRSEIASPPRTESPQPARPAVTIRRALPAQAVAALPVQSPAIRPQGSLGSPSTTSTSPPAFTYRVANMATGDTLNVRAGPGSNYPVVGRISRESKEITLRPGRTANGSTVWQQISVGGYTGWVNEIYIRREFRNQ